MPMGQSYCEIYQANGKSIAKDVGPQSWQKPLPPILANFPSYAISTDPSMDWSFPEYVHHAGMDVNNQYSQ